MFSALAVIVAIASTSQLGIVPEPESNRTAKPDTVRVLVFGAQWCQPCQEMHREIERELLKPGMGWQRYIEFIDADENHEEIKLLERNQQGGISLPQIVIIEDSRPVIRMIGRQTMSRLSAVANAIITSQKKVGDKR